ncbi:MAG: hypothetical protein QOC83_5552 [Pseudonocardiales bacterium]|nr:hypothetical protein [Pseudonocardiales bacterium]
MGFHRAPAVVSNAQKCSQCGSIGESGAPGRAEGVFLGRSGGLWGMVAEVFG